MSSKTIQKKICAKDVTIRKFKDSKCNLLCNGKCVFDKITKDSITKADTDLPFFDGDYIPENFCRALAALYLYSPEKKKELFSGSGWRCVEYKCGHIRMLNDCNHRMCVLAHLGESIEVRYTKTDCYCSECIQQRI